MVFHYIFLIYWSYTFLNRLSLYNFRLHAELLCYKYKISLSKYYSQCLDSQHALLCVRWIYKSSAFDTLWRSKCKTNKCRTDNTGPMLFYIPTNTCMKKYSIFSIILKMRHAFTGRICVRPCDWPTPHISLQFNLNTMLSTKSRIW